MISHQEQLDEALKAGVLPDFMKQEEQILEGTDYDSKAVDYIRKIINKLKPDNHDKIKNAAIKIYISSSPIPNAFTIHKGVPILVVNKGVLDLAKTEDELAAIIAHELMHIHLHKQFLEHKESNKAEESLCDCESVKALDQAGYQRDAAISIFGRFPPRKKDKWGILNRFFDPHPSWEIRTRMLGSALAIYEKEHGLSRKVATTPLPDFIVAGRTLRWPDYLDAKLEAQQYEKRAVHKQMHVLATLIQEETKIFDDDEFFERRIEKIKTLISKLTINLNDPREKKAFGKLVDSIASYARLMGFSYDLNGLMDLAFQAAGHKRPPYPPYGKIEEFAYLGKQFVAAKTEAEASECSVKMNQLVKDHKEILQSEILSHFDIQFFVIPEFKKPYRFFTKNTVASAVMLPWNRHLEWSKKNTSIQETLNIMGVLRVVENDYPPEEKAALGYNLKRNRDDELMWVIFSSGSGVLKEGKLFPTQEKLEIKIVETFPSDEDEQKRLKQMDMDAETMEIDWSLLIHESKGDEKNYPKKIHPFVEKYKEQLRMQCTFQEGGFAFANKFMEHLKKLAEHNQKAADRIFEQVLGLQPRPHPSNMNYGLGVSTNHPFIQYALKHFDKFGKLINEKKIFTHATKALVLRLPTEREQDNYDLVVNYVVSNLPPRSLPYFLLDFFSEVDSIKKDQFKFQHQYSESLFISPLEKRWVFHGYENAFNFERPKLIAAREKGELKLTDQEFKRQAYSLDNLLKIPDHFPFVWLYEAYLMLKNNPEKRLSNEEFAYIALMRNQLNKRFKSESIDTENDEVFNAFNREFTKCEDYFFTHTLEEKDPDEMIKKFYLLKESKTYFKDFNDIEKLQKRIRQHLQDMQTPQRRREFLEKLLFTREVRFDHKYPQITEPSTIYCDFIDPQFQKWVIEEYTKALTEVLGKDKPEESMHHRESKAVDMTNPKFAAVDDILKNAPLNVAVPVLRRLADSISAQKTLSYYIRDQIEKATTDKLLKTGGNLGGVAEILITELPKCKDKTLIPDTIYFLLSAKENFDYDDYVRKICAVSVSGPLSRVLDDRMTLKSLYEKNREQTLQRLRSAQHFFRDLSLEQQTLAIDQLLFPAEEPLNLKQSKAFVLDTIFGSSGGRRIMKMLANGLCGRQVSSVRSDKEARQIVESYLEALEEVALDPRHKVSIQSRERLILAAMLVTHAKTQETAEKSSRGEALRQLLEAMGPAGRKLAQAIESHPETPEDIKSALKSAKTNAAPPARWEVHAWVDQCYQTQNQLDQKVDGIQYLDEMLGSGSYGVTMKAVKNSGATTAITFLRPHMLEQSEDEFMILDKASKILIKKNPVFKPFDDMQKEAALASRDEVNMEIAAKQQEVAKNLYSNLEVRVGEIDFQFGVAEWIGSGSKYKETKVVPGSHFNDLDESPDFKGIKKEAAQALLAAELYLLLKGGPIDSDRHGGQQKLIRTSKNQVYVGNFDFGGMTLLSQTPWQKKLLGSLVGEAMWESNKTLGARPLDGTLLNNLAEKYIQQYAKESFTADNGTTQLIGHKNAQRFVGRIKRGLLALGNFLSEIQTEPEKIKGIIGAILASGDIDPDINKAMRAKLGLFEYKLDELAHSEAAKQIRIKRR